MSMSAIISDVTTIATGFTSVIADWFDVITGEPLVMFFLLVGFLGLGIGLVKRLIRL